MADNSKRRREGGAPGVRRLGPGLWEITADAGKDPVTGKRRRTTQRFRGTFVEAKKARAELVTEVSTGRHTGTRSTMDDLFRAWIPELERKNRKPTTIYNYRRRYEHDIRPTLGKVEVRKLTATAVRQSCAKRAEEAGVAPFSPNDLRRGAVSARTKGRAKKAAPPATEIRTSPLFAAEGEAPPRVGTSAVHFPYRTRKQELL